MRFCIGHFLLAAILALATIFALPSSTQLSNLEKDELAWRTQHVADLQKPDGWLSLVGLEWLQLGEIPVGSAADSKIHLPPTAPAHLAILKFQNDAVTLLPPKEGFPVGLMVDGAPAKEQVLRADPDKDKLNSRVTFGTINFYVIRRGEDFAVRVKDSKSPTLLEFHGLNWFAPNPTYRVTAKWTPYVPAKNITLARLVGKSYSL